MATDFYGFDEWLNEILFDHKADSDLVVWLGDGKWFMMSVESPDKQFVIELKPAKIEAAS